jgi:LPXTG-motif cell wall-anchored protein
MFSEFDPNKDYHDVKAIIEVDAKTEKQQWWTWIVAGVIVFAGSMFLLLRKKKKNVPVPVQRVIDPYKEAMQQLEIVRKQELTSIEFYSRVVDIFRYYVLYKKNILSLQKTTDDLVLQLKQIGLQKSQFEELAQALRLSDFVKFAKYKPSKEDDDLFFNGIKKSIETIEVMK